MGAHVCFSRVSFDVGVLKSFNRGLFVNCAFSWFLLSFALGKQNLLLVFREWNIYFYSLFARGDVLRAYVETLNSRIGAASGKNNR